MLWFFNFVKDNSLPSQGSYGCSVTTEFVSVSFQYLQPDNFSCGVWLINSERFSHLLCFSYWCIALVLPTFTSQPTDVTIAEMKALVLPCSAGGFPTPTIIWYKEGVTVTWHLQLESGALSIGSVDATDEGNYECVAVNTAHYEIRTSMTLTVQGTCISNCDVAFSTTLFVGLRMQ